MAKPKLIILEGPDGVGKTTQAKRIAEVLKAKIVSQPSTDNCVGFIRAEAKNNKSFSGLERQLLIGISHTVDAFTKFRDDENVVMDRSYLSGMVYGKLTGLDGYEVALLTNILSSVYKTAMGDRYDVDVIFLTAEARLDEPDTDVFESTIQWTDLRQEYTTFFQYARDGRLALFSQDERVNKLSITGSTPEQVTNLILKLVE